MNSQTKRQPFEIYQHILKSFQEGGYSEALEQCDQLLNDNKKNAFFLCFKRHILNELTVEPFNFYKLQKKTFLKKL